MSHFFALIFRMRYIKRWGLMKNTEPENLEEHSLEVAMLAHCLALVRRDMRGIPCDPERAAVIALFHDATETLTGDLPTPVKHRSEDIRSAYRTIEDAARVRLLSQLPEALRPAYEGLLAPGPEDAALVQLVHGADKLAAYLKCVAELAAGNTEFRLAARQTRAALDALAMPEVEYFMQEFVPSFSLSIDELE